MEFEWDPEKALRNLQKHGVSFEEACSAFGDALGSTFPDLKHSHTEQRWLTFGVSRSNRLLLVAHVERQERIRIVSARLATRKELRIYEEG